MIRTSRGHGSVADAGRLDLALAATTQGNRDGAIPASLGSWGTAAAARGPTSPAMPRIRVYDQRAGHLVPTVV